MSKTSKTDWDRLAKMGDEQIDTSDMPELGDDFFANANANANANLSLPAKEPVTLRMDADVLNWFRSQGKGYQTRINKLLRSYMESRVETPGKNHKHP